MDIQLQQIREQYVDRMLKGDAAFYEDDEDYRLLPRTTIEMKLIYQTRMNIMEWFSCTVDEGVWGILYEANGFEKSVPVFAFWGYSGDNEPRYLLLKCFCNDEISFRLLELRNSGVTGSLDSSSEWLRILGLSVERTLKKISEAGDLVRACLKHDMKDLPNIQEKCRTHRVVCWEYKERESNLEQADIDDYMPMRRLDETPIEKLNLSIRSYNCLKRAGVNTIGDLKMLSADHIVRIRNMGRMSWYEVAQKLKALGLEVQLPSVT